MKRICALIVYAAIFVFVAAQAAAKEGESRPQPLEVSWLDSWMGQKTATGTWGGVRDDLEKKGIAVSSNYTTDIGGNPVGGLDQTAVYSGFLSCAVAFDFEKMVSIPGLALTVSNFLASGRDISVPLGNFFSPQEVYTDGNYYLGELDLSLSILDNTMVFEAGRIFAGDIFAVSPMFQYYLTSAVNGRMEAVPSNVFFPHYRTAAWGTRFTYQPNDQWSVVTGLYNADPNISEPDRHGTDFSIDTSDGALIASQLTYKHGHTKKDNSLPGSATFGGYCETSNYAELSNPSSVWRGNYGLYVMVDQMIYKGEWPKYEGPAHMRSDARHAEQRKRPYHQQTAFPQDRPVGLSAWCATSAAPKDCINTMPYQFAAGFVYQGLPPNRNRDVTAVCFIMGSFSDALPGQSKEMVLELNHRFQLGPWFYLTPDVQYIINPNGFTERDNALILGFETSVNF
jgi:porin